jgi:hypothetical protein
LASPRSIAGGGLAAGGALTTYALIIPFLIFFKCVLPRYAPQTSTPRADAVDSRTEPMLAPSSAEPASRYGTFSDYVFQFGSAKTPYPIPTDDELRRAPPLDHLA